MTPAVTVRAYGNNYCICDRPFLGMDRTRSHTGRYWHWPDTESPSPITAPDDAPIIVGGDCWDCPGHDPIRLLPGRTAYVRLRRIGDPHLVGIVEVTCAPDAFERGRPPRK